MKNKVLNTLTIGLFFVSICVHAQKHESGVDLSNPVPGARVSQKFGRGKDPISGKLYFHEGLDLAAKIGTVINSPADGIIEVAVEDYKERKGSGRTIIISHDHGLKSYFYHLNEIKVKEGDFVKRNETIGNVGATGEGTGPHLHFEVRKNGKAVDPLPLVTNI